MHKIHNFFHNYGSVNSSSYNQQHSANSQFGFNSIIQQQQQQQRQAAITPSSLTPSSSFITGNSSSHLIQVQQQQKSQFDSSGQDAFGFGNNSIGNNSSSSHLDYFPNPKLNTSNPAINRPSNAGNSSSSNSANAALLNTSSKQMMLSFDNGFMNSNYPSGSYHHQVSDQSKLNLPSVTPPMSTAGSSFFNNNANNLAGKCIRTY